jgi:hypothetical protein
LQKSVPDAWVLPALAHAPQSLDGADVEVEQEGQRQEGGQDRVEEDAVHLVVQRIHAQTETNKKYFDNGLNVAKIVQIVASKMVKIVAKIVKIVAKLCK